MIKACTRSSVLESSSSEGRGGGTYKGISCTIGLGCKAPANHQKYQMMVLDGEVMQCGGTSPNDLIFTLCCPCRSHGISSIAEDTDCVLCACALTGTLWVSEELGNKNGEIVCGCGHNVLNPCGRVTSNCVVVAEAAGSGPDHVRHKSTNESCWF